MERDIFVTTVLRRFEEEMSIGGKLQLVFQANFSSRGETAVVMDQKRKLKSKASCFY